MHLERDPKNSATLGELRNMIAGNFKLKVTSLADHCMLSAPTVITGDDYALSSVEPAEGFTLALKYDGEPVWVSLITHSESRRKKSC